MVRLFNCKKFPINGGSDSILLLERSTVRRFPVNLWSSSGNCNWQKNLKRLTWGTHLHEIKAPWWTRIIETGIHPLIDLLQSKTTCMTLKSLISTPTSGRPLPVSWKTPVFWDVSRCALSALLPIYCWYPLMRAIRIPKGRAFYGLQGVLFHRSVFTSSSLI